MTADVTEDEGLPPGDRALAVEDPVLAEALSPVRRGRRRRVRTAFVVTHRWLSLVLGLLLVVITTTGAVLVYEPEIQRALNPIYDRATGPAVVSLADAVEIVQRERPDFDANTVIAEHGVYRVVDVDWLSYVAVDPGSGRIIGEGEISNAFFGAMEQVHLCFFSCEGMPWYASWMMATVPGLGEMTWGGFLLGVRGCSCWSWRSPGSGCGGRADVAGSTPPGCG